MGGTGLDGSQGESLIVIFQVKKLNRFVVSCCTVLLVGLTAGCGKAPQDMGCTDSDVQLHARKLLAMQIKEWQLPPEARIGGMDDLRKSSPEAAAALNGMRAKSISPSDVRLTEIEQLSLPKTPLESADPDESNVPVALRSKATGNKRLYSCTAQAHIKLPHEVVASLPATSRKALGLDQEGLHALVVFETQLTPDNEMWVAASFGNPLVEIALRSLLSQTAQAGKN